MTQANLFQLIHEFSSIITLAVLLLAAMLALFIFYKNAVLRQKKGISLMETSTDLESMERRLFQIIFFGFFLLTGIIVSSFYFFFQLHFLFFLKLSVTLLTWIIFGGLLWCRYHYGLRGRVAIFSTLIGAGIVLALYVFSFIF